MVQALRAIVTNSADSDAGASWLARAATGDDPDDWRRILQTSVLLGASDRARAGLETLGISAADDPITYYFGIEAAGMTGRSDMVAALFARSPFTETWKTAGEQAARILLQAGQLEETAAIRPQDLAANFGLWQAAMAAGEYDSAEMYRLHLQQFTYDAIAPQDQTLFAQALLTMPSLVDHGIWDQAQLERVLTALVWNHDDNDLVRDTLQQLAERDNGDKWPFLLAEMAHRRGELDTARAGYAQLASANATSKQAQLRLAQIAGSYEHKLADPVSQFAAELGLPENSMTVGSNLYHNGDFEIWGPTYSWLPEQWIASPYLTGDYAKSGVAVQDMDTLDGWEGLSARVDGLWQSEPHVAHLGYDYRGDFPAHVTDGQTYLFSLAYRTELLEDGDVRIWFNSLSDEAQQADDFELLLPATDGVWQSVACLVTITTPGGFASTVHLRNRGVGRAWFDAVALQPITLPSNAPISAEWHC